MEAMHMKLVYALDVIKGYAEAIENTNCISSDNTLNEKISESCNHATHGDEECGNIHHQHSMMHFEESGKPSNRASDFSSLLDAKSSLDLDPVTLATVKYLLLDRKLSPEILIKYKIGIGTQNFRDEQGNYITVPVVAYPMFRPLSAGKPIESLINSSDHQAFAKYKLRGVGKEYKHFQRMVPSGSSQQAFFGMNLIDTNSSNIIITEGEYDAMAAHQATGMPAVSLPNGCSNMPVQLIKYIDHATKVYLWMDNDEAGQLHTLAYSKKIGMNRTYIVSTDVGIKDANDALRIDKSLITKYICNATTMMSKNLVGW